MQLGAQVPDIPALDVDQKIRYLTAPEYAFQVNVASVVVGAGELATATLETVAADAVDDVRTRAGAMTNINANANENLRTTTPELTEGTV